MEQNSIKRSVFSPGPHIGAGLIVVTAGVILLLNQAFGLYLPPWMVSWPMFMLILGLYFNARHNFASPFGYFLLILGAVNLPQYIFPGFEISNFFWPIVFIAAGIWMIMFRKHL